jgi:hypothetical protein
MMNPGWPKRIVCGHTGTLVDESPKWASGPDDPHGVFGHRSKTTPVKAKLNLPDGNAWSETPGTMLYCKHDA